MERTSSTRKQSSPRYTESNINLCIYIISCSTCSLEEFVRSYLQIIYFFLFISKIKPHIIFDKSDTQILSKKKKKRKKDESDTQSFRRKKDLPTFFFSILHYFCFYEIIILRYNVRRVVAEKQLDHLPSFPQSMVPTTCILSTFHLAPTQQPPHQVTSPFTQTKKLTVTHTQKRKRKKLDPFLHQTALAVPT